MVSTCVGRYRRMRCAEVVTTILMNPIREDPWGSLTANIILKTRRLLRKSEARVVLSQRRSIESKSNQVDGEKLPLAQPLRYSATQKTWASDYKEIMLG